MIRLGKYKSLCRLARLIGGTTITGVSLGDKKRTHVRTRAVFVIAGMSLFTIGFLVTIDTLPRGADLLGSSEGSALARSPSMLLFAGFIVSLAGLALATIAPTIMFVRTRNSKS